MKVSHCLIPIIAFSVLASGAKGAESHSGIKMLMTAATASRHHRSPSGSASVSGAGDSQSGIRKLIAAATASRHLRSVGTGQRAFRDAGSDGEGEGPAAILTPDPGSAADAASGHAPRSAASAAGVAPAAGAAANGTLSGVSRATAQGVAHDGASGFGTANASAGARSRSQSLSPLVMRASTQIGGAINGTGVGRPSFGAIGGAAVIGHNVASINGTAIRSRR